MICDREVYNQLGGSDHLLVLLTLTRTEQTTSQQKEPNWNLSKFQSLIDVLCRELATDNSKDINTSVQQLTDCILQEIKQAIPRHRRKDYKATGATTYSVSMTNSQKPENDLSSSLHQSTISSTTRQAPLLTKRSPRNPTRHSRKRLAHSAWRKTHRSSGI